VSPLRITHVLSVGDTCVSSTTHDVHVEHIACFDTDIEDLLHSGRLRRGVDFVRAALADNTHAVLVHWCVPV
jgi:hypothetical protein